jgi:Tol biopolymer transport system component
MSARAWRRAVAAAAVLGGVVAIGGQAEAVAPGSNGTILFVASERCDPQESFCPSAARAIYEMRPDGSGVTKLLDQNTYFDSPSQAKDGSRILLSVTFGDPEIYKARRTGIPDDSYVTDGCGTSWAPDSIRLAFTSEAGCYATLGLLTLPYPAGGVGDLTGEIETAGGNRFATLASHPADDRDPDWSPNGAWIAFASNRSGTYQIWVVRPDGSGLRQVTSDRWEKSFPAFSPDSGRILFTRARGAESDLWTVKLDGTDLRRVTNTSAFETQGAYSPDGSRLVVARQPSRSDQSGSNLYKMRLDGTGVVKLTTVSSARWAHTDPFWANVPSR